MSQQHPENRKDLDGPRAASADQDFRGGLYAQYVSGLKKTGASMDPAAQRAYTDWCTRNYLPLVADLDRTVPVLEIGCGAGYFMDFISEEGFGDVSGLDISSEQIEIAHKRGVKTATQADVFEALPARHGVYGAIFAIDFLEHFSRAELVELVPLIRESLAPGGRFITQTPNGQALHGGAVIHGDLTHLTIFTPRSLEQLLRTHGFVDIMSMETALPGSGMGWRARRALWSMVRQAANAVKRIEGVRSERIWTQNFISSARAPTSQASSAGQP
jgi:2-polyprenyl-3-methyl-5-hydroxy-6-metoxy-1,4-benzoquinol methylase